MHAALKRYEYVVWLRDTTLPPDDEDHVWPGVFYIDAANEQDALNWGNRLAAAYCERGGDKLVRSSATLADGASANLPVVVYGHLATDDEIGW